jgi:hypothetical protein
MYPENKSQGQSDVGEMSEVSDVTLSFTSLVMSTIISSIVVLICGNKRSL